MSATYADMNTKPASKSTGNLPATVAAVLASHIHLAAEAGGAPEWVQVFPAGPVVATNDGRAFLISDPAALITMARASRRWPILVDYDHLSFYDPAMNGASRAAGWATDLDVRDGAIWARVEWTPAAARQIADREWRFISPEFQADYDTGEIIGISAISLVNRPAFQMTALARSQSTPSGDPEMKSIALALGLPETASEEAILAKINATQTELASARTPSPERFMPRGDYDTVLARATAAETELATLKKASRDAEVETVIAAAVGAGKITPASREHYVALAATDAGLASVKALVASLQPVIPDVNVDTQPGGGDGTLTPIEQHIARSLGVSDAEFLASR